MATILNTANSTVSPGYGAVPPLTYTTTTTGTSGQFLTSGSNGTSWVNPSTTFNSSNNKTIMTIPHGEDKVVLEKGAALEVKGNVVINGIDLEERLKVIEKVLMIPERDAIMEAKYPSLKKKFDEYINALEKYKTFERIKGTYD
jgi:hypothetical protein